MLGKDRPDIASLPVKLLKLYVSESTLDNSILFRHNACRHVRHKLARFQILVKVHMM
jgi:hypothetical protein